MFYSSVGDRQTAFNGRSPAEYSGSSTDSGPGQPVRVINGSACSAPSECYNYYRRPYSQQGSIDNSTDCAQSSGDLSFLYDRAQNSSYSPDGASVNSGYVSQPPRPTLHNPARQDFMCAPLSPPGEYYGSIKAATPAPIRQLSSPQSPAALNGARDNQLLQSGGATSNGGESYLPFSRAMPAPIQQQQISPRFTGSGVDRSGPQFNGIHQAAAPSQADAGTPNSVRSPPIRSPTEYIESPLSQLNLQRGGGSGRHPPTSVPVSGVRARDPRQQTQTLPHNLARRQSAPGPVGGVTGEAGSRKPWSYTPSFGVPAASGASSTGRTGAAPVGSARPVVHLTDTDNTFYKPQTITKTSEGPRIMFNGSSANCTTTVDEYDAELCRGSRGGSVSTDGRLNNRSAVIDDSSIRFNLREGDEVGDYEQTSIRYTGKVNPSKTFRLLQTVTGSDTETDVKLARATATASRQARRRQPSRDELEDQLQQSDADDIVDISYVGANIPSRTFRILQEAIGELDPPAADAPPTDDVTDEGFGSSGRNVRVVHLRPTMKKHSSLDNILSYTDL